MNRTPFIDHLRVALTALVVFHHAAITYGASGGWYLYQAPRGSSPGLTVFVTANQAFFMGFFFLLAGYFTPGSLVRKGPARFAADRLLRLGVPLLVFGFVLDPFTVALAHAHNVSALLSYWVWLMAHGWFSSGPLWFAEALLIFTAAFLLWRTWRPHDEAGRGGRLPGHRAILFSALAVGAAAFALRLLFPVGVAVSNLQFGYFASYAFLFAVGVLAAPGRWLERVPWALARPWLVVSAVAFAGLIAFTHVAGAAGFAGGWSAKAAVYAFFEPFFAFGVILGLLWLFRARLDRTGRAGRFLSARAYAVYVVHPPFLVGIALLLDKWDAPGPLMAALTGTAALAASLLAGSALLLLPGARRVL